MNVQRKGRNAELPKVYNGVFFVMMRRLFSTKLINTSFLFSPKELNG